jgi:hypothetical protein
MLDLHFVFMAKLNSLPTELLIRIVDFVATPTGGNAKQLPHSDADSCRQLKEGPSYRGLSYSNTILATSPTPDIQSLQSLRLVSRTLNKLSTPLLFSVIRVLPLEESAQRYTNILESEDLNLHVKKVVFQTQLKPNEYLDCDPGEIWNNPNPYLLDGRDEISRFENLTHAELIFSSICCAEDEYWDGTPEIPGNRDAALFHFYASLVKAENLSSLSIQNLQSYIPEELKEDGRWARNETFKSDFETVMRRLKQLSLQIVTEVDTSKQPARTLTYSEIHHFFNYELEKYWISPIAENLEYLKLYANKEVYWGFFPACELPVLRMLKTLVLGDVSFVSEKQIQWILQHANTLEELILDNAMIGIAVEIEEYEADVASRTVLYKMEHPRYPYGGYQPKERSDLLKPHRWLTETRWHHLFRRFQEGLPKLKHFAINHSHWDDRSFEHADALSNALREERYAFFKKHYWMSFADYNTETFVFKKWEGDEHDSPQIEKPDCDEEDWQALNELLDQLRRRR